MIRTTAAIVILVFFAACGARQENASEQKSESAGIEMQKEKSANFNETEAVDEEEVINPEVLTSLAAQAILIDSMHRFVKNANLNFRTKDVVETSLAIEKLVSQAAGFIEVSEIRSEEREFHSVPFTKELNKEIKKYTTVSTITARVPAAKLNDFLLDLQPFVVYLEHRNVTSTNVAFDQYLKKLVQNRISSHSLRVLNGTRNKASDLDQLLEREMQSDREKIEEMKLDEQIAYSTVQLQVYGPDQVSIIKVPAISLDEYKPTFGSRALAGISIGWNIVMVLLIGLISIWPILIAGLVVLVLLRRRKMRKNNQV